MFNSGDLVLDLLHNFFLENGARMAKIRVYETTDHPIARQMLGYLFVRGGVHALAYAKALEELTGRRREEDAADPEHPRRGLQGGAAVRRQAACTAIPCPRGRPGDEYETLLYSASEGVATVTLNRPERLNTIVPPMPDELEAAVGRAVRDHEVKVIVVRGAGRAFCAGYDFGGGLPPLGRVARQRRPLGSRQGLRLRDGSGDRARPRSS